ncbi:MAG: hypothetical protein FD167_3600 [bacterium]|nr:MAG: hypothetical protein FD167_3600 [bacterium]
MNKQTLADLQSQNQWKAFWQNQKDFIAISSLGQITSLPKTFALMAGSFNPLHEGHQELAQIVEGLINQPVIFELSIANVDKPWLDEATVLKRISQFIGYKSIVVTKAATFIEKTHLFGGCNYILGYDTALRLLSSRYYDSEEAMIDCLNSIVKQGGRFLVAARMQDNQVKTLADLIIPKDLQSFFLEIPVERFRVDISSTILRSQGKNL